MVLSRLLPAKAWPEGSGLSLASDEYRSPFGSRDIRRIRLNIHVSIATIHGYYYETSLFHTAGDPGILTRGVDANANLMPGTVAVSPVSCKCWAISGAAESASISRPKCEMGVVFGICDYIAICQRVFGDRSV